METTWGVELLDNLLNFLQPVGWAVLQQACPVVHELRVFCGLTSRPDFLE